MKIKKNGKVINLTESDLKRIVKRTLTELKSLNESITVNDIKCHPLTQLMVVQLKHNTMIRHLTY